jgi:hypothetical protein
MRAKDDTNPESVERWIATLRVEIHGPRATDMRGSSRHLSRPLKEAELTALNERLCAAAEAFLEEIDALDGEAGEGWAEALASGSWVWRIQEAG